MTQNQIITLVLTSSLLSAFLTIFFQWIFKFLDYKLDYKKKIIEKRINAYENIDILTWQLGIITQDGKMSWSNIFNSEKDFDNFIVYLALARKNQIWLSKNLSDKLQELNFFLINLQNDKNPKNDKEYNFIGNENFKKIRAYRKEIEKLYKLDFYKLHKVDRFLKKDIYKEKSYKIHNKAE